MSSEEDTPKQVSKRPRLDKSLGFDSNDSEKSIAVTSPEVIKTYSQPDQVFFQGKCQELNIGIRNDVPVFKKASSLLKEPVPSTSKDSNLTNTFSANKKELHTFPHNVFASCSDNSSHIFCQKDVNEKSSSNKDMKNNNVQLDRQVVLHFNKPKKSTSKKKKNNFTLPSNRIIRYFNVPSLKKENWNTSLTLAENVRSEFKALKEKTEMETKAQAQNNKRIFDKFHSCSGLEDDCEKSDFELPNYFDNLPNHILETILCQMPLLDLMNYRLVCRTWNFVISDEKFMDWKKTYYHLKIGLPKSLNYMKVLCESLKISSADSCIFGMMRYMHEMYKRRPSSDMYHLITEKSELGQTANLVLHERFPDFTKNESQVWCLLALVVTISHTINDILEIYHILTGSRCSLHDLTNAFYAIAAFFLYFKVEFHTGHGFHFRMFCALHHIENSKQSSNYSSLTVAKKVILPGQQNMHKYSDTFTSNLTYEQLRILNHCIQPNQIIKVMALAGSGKTTTLIHMTKLYSQLKFLNLMYNNSVCQHAKKVFPSNVTCKTMHSLAYEVCGKQLKHKLSTKVRPHDIAGLLEFFGDSCIPVHCYASYVINTINSFVSSSDETISMNHVPDSLFDQTLYNSSFYRNEIYKDAIQIWLKMIDKDNKVPITHDVYLKVYQLSKPKLIGYQCLMVDEAQDCNPAMLHVLINQDLPLILVGDPNQQIYGFRGAKNAFDTIIATHTYHLTKSFRFGPSIAYTATVMLGFLKHNHGDILVGSNKLSFITGKREGQTAIITRTNSQLFEEAARFCSPNKLGSESVMAAFAGGLSSYGFNQLLDVYNLKQNSGKKMSDKFMSRFKSYQDLLRYAAENGSDSELKSKLDIVCRFGSELPILVKKIQEKCSHPMKYADVVFTTAHKSKGLEFDTVVITDDYPMLDLADKIIDVKFGDNEQEINTLYVAVTRAKKCLVMSDALQKIMIHSQENFERPISSKSFFILGDPPVLCAECGEYFAPHTVLSVFRKGITTTRNKVLKEGYLCMRCCTDPIYCPFVEDAVVIIYLDPYNNYGHTTMSCLVGPLPTDPPIDYRHVNQYFEDQDVYLPVIRRLR